MSWHPHSQKVKFGIWKKRLKEYGRGCGTLIDRLERVRTKDGFLETLAEFNIARSLKRREIDFDYEKPGCQDFVFDDLDISVKSIMRKDYEKAEGRDIEILSADVKKSGFRKSIVKSYPDSKATITAHPDGSIERLEVGGNGRVLSSEFFQKSAIIQHVKDFDGRPSGKNKVLFFVVQNDD